MNDIKQQIIDKIKQYDRIILSRHIRPDGDAMGSTMGMRHLIKNTYPDKEVYVIAEDHTDYVSFLGQEDEQLPDEMYRDALLIVLDTADEARVSNRKLRLAKEIVKIDHHVDIAPFGDLAWIEDNWAATCELVTTLCMEFPNDLKMTKEAATCLFTGMTTDSGRFRYIGTSGNTMRCAGFLLDHGVDIETLYARLYLEDFDFYKFEAYIYERMQITENGVAYLFVDREMQEKFGLTLEQASSTVGLMSEIKGSIIWLAFIENPDGSIRVRLRSRFVTINKLAEEYGGGGHICASGATVYSRDEMQELLDKADAISRDYKATHFYL